MPRSKRLRFLSTDRRLILCTLFLCAFCVNAYAQNEEKTKPPVPADIILEFKSNGQLISSPPELILPGQDISVRVVLDESFWSARINKVLSSYLKTLENLNDYNKINKIITYGIKDKEINKIKGEMVFKLLTYLKSTKYIKPELTTFYKNKINLLGIKSDETSTDYYSPPLAELIDPIYQITIFYYDKNGIQLDGNSNIGGNGTTKPLKSGTNNSFLQTDKIRIPKECSELRYELRMENNINKTITSWSANSTLIFPTEAYNILVDSIKNNLNDDFMISLKNVMDKVKKLKSNPMDDSIDLTKLKETIEDQLKITSQIKDALNDTTDNAYEKWIKRWLWLTNGIPKINPFYNQSNIFQESPKDKVSAQDKALYEIFDNMVSKQAFQIKDLKLIDSGFKNIPKIKAALAEEAANQPDNTQEYDRLLYKGILRQSCPDQLVYMRHLDVSNNYLIMGLSPKKEITEKERMLILAENKSVPVKLSFSFTPTHIVTDDAFITTDLSNTKDEGQKGDINGPIANFNGTEKNKNKIREDRLKKVNSILQLAGKLNNDVLILRSLTLAPILPVFFDHDQTPDYITDNLMHNYLIDPPAVAAYSVKVIKADDTEKEVATGSYRIKKLYRFRFKAGILYSFLKKNDYTEISTNNYSLDNSDFGIDGTFGVQFYFKKQDIRSDEGAWRWYAYGGLSMRNISENFYVGLGVEPLSGLAIGLNAHLGKRESLYGNNGVPTSIRKTWGVSFAPSILLDTSLFIKLFSFGSSNKSLLGL